MSGGNYVVVAYVIGLGLLVGYVLVLWATRSAKHR
jgi:hypothetical protein